MRYGPVGPGLSLKGHGVAHLRRYKQALFVRCRRWQRGPRHQETGRACQSQDLPKPARQQSTLFPSRCKTSLFDSSQDKNFQTLISSHSDDTESLARTDIGLKMPAHLIGSSSRSRLVNSGKCLMSAMGHQETILAAPGDRRSTARRGRSGFLEFDNWFEATKDKTFTIKRHRVLLYIHPFILEIFRHHFFHGSVARFLVRPLDPGKYD